jgi:hypothetical protein
MREKNREGSTNYLPLLKLILASVLVCGTSLTTYAQANSGPQTPPTPPAGTQNPPATPTTPPQSTTPTTPSATPPAAATENPPPTPAVAVDSARKSDLLSRPVNTEENSGRTVGRYEIKQSAEFGGRITSFSGNTGMWDTFVNLGSGPRLLEYTFNMHAKEHMGILFDDLSFNNFGYGGDPNDVSRLRISKNKIYNFDASFRRDQNIFDYDLLANPLNPATSVPNIPVLNSPHEFLMVRRMSDIDLHLFPQSRVRFNLGYSRVVNQGNEFTTVHQGTEAQVLAPTHDTTDRYQAGVSIHFDRTTNLTYNQFYTFYKGDSTEQLNALPFNLAGPIPVDLGLPFNTVAGQPCATPILGTGFANPTCNGFFNYNVANRIRNNYPTEQLSLQSRHFKNLDISARLNYSEGRSNLPGFLETFGGLKSSSRLRDYTFFGNSLTHRRSLTGDGAVTWFVTDRLSVTDTFRYSSFRFPGMWDYTTNSLFGATLLSTPNPFTPATCPPPFTAATCPQHNASSGADVIVDNLASLLRQDSKVNTLEFEYQFHKRFSGHAGYRYEHRNILDIQNDSQLQTFFPGPTAALANRGACAGQPLNPDGTCTVTVATANNVAVPINANSLIVGFAARPIDSLKIRFDTEIYYADNTFTRISPRHMQSYRLRAAYKPKEWLNFGSAITIFENRNEISQNMQHDRSYSFTASIEPPESHWGLDLSYDYSDIYSATNICFVATPSPAGSLTCGAPFLTGISVYADKGHFASGSIFFRPIPRVTAYLGYALTSTVGNTLILNPLAPTGPLSFNYHLPIGAVDIQFSKAVMFKAKWNYYGYNEKSDPGPTLPRDFRGNVVTLSLRYAM